MFQRLDHRAGHYLLLISLWAVLSLPNLGGTALWDIDEGNNAECFREMLASGNWIVPTFNYRLRDDKPALLYWAQMLCARVVGVNEWAARLPSALAALGCILIVYELGRRLFEVRAALLAGVILASSSSFLIAGHFANPDALLLMCTCLALALCWQDWQSDGGGSQIGIGIACGLGVLAKGPIGLVMPVAIAVVYLAWQRQLHRLWDVRVGGLVLAFIIVAVPWYACVAAETKGAWIFGFWKKHHAARMTTALESHSGPFFYYLPVLILGATPWSIFIGSVVWYTGRCLWRPEGPENPHRRAVGFLTIWFGVYFVFFSLVKTKLPNYILPVYPPLALLTGYYLEQWRRGEWKVPGWVTATSLFWFSVFGAGVAAGLLIMGGVLPLPGLGNRIMPGLASWALLGAVPAVAALVAAVLWWRNLRGGLIVTIAMASVLVIAPLIGWGLLSSDEHKACRPLANALPEDQIYREVRIGAYRYFQPSLVFYCQREVDRLHSDDQALGLLGGPRPAFLFVPEADWDRLRKRAPADVHVLGRHRDIYSGRTVVVVGKDPESSASGLTRQDEAHPGANRP